MVKFARRDFTAFSDLPQVTNDRVVAVTKAICEMIVGSDTGWTYDERTPADTYIFVPARSSDYYNFQFPVSYLRNTENGAKLMVSTWFSGRPGQYGGGYANTAPYFSYRNYLYPYYFSSHVDENGSYSINQLGIMMSMIPAGSNSEFPSVIPNDFTTKFIPDDAIPLVTECCYINSGNWIGTDDCYLGKVVSGGIYSCAVLVDSEFVMLFGGVSSTSVRPLVQPIYALGKIIGTLAHENDSSISSNYGAIRFIQKVGTNLSFSRNINGTNISFDGRNFELTVGDNYNFFYNNTYAVFFDENGTLIPTCCTYGPSGVELLSNAIANDASTNYTRWCPFAVTTLYDPVNNGVVPGDGFKGYLDTNLFRCAVCTAGNFYNNGQFVGLSNNMLVAWDQTATDTIM